MLAGLVDPDVAHTPAFASCPRATVDQVVWECDVTPLHPDTLPGSYKGLQGLECTLLVVVLADVQTWGAMTREMGPEGLDDLRSGFPLGLDVEVP
jgi:hypothetical protein